MILQKLIPGLSCDKAMLVLQQYLDGEVDDKTAAKVAKHLAKCPDCDKESDVYRRIKTSLSKPHRNLNPQIISTLKDFTDNLANSSTE